MYTTWQVQDKDYGGKTDEKDHMMLKETFPLDTSSKKTQKFVRFFHYEHISQVELYAIRAKVTMRFNHE